MTPRRHGRPLPAAGQLGGGGQAAPRRAESADPRVVGLEKRYGRVQALVDVGLRVEGGQIAGLVGPNGAGKTTTMRAILGLVRCERGVVRVDGTPVTGVVRADVIGALVDRPSVYPYLSGRGNLEVAALALFRRVFNHDLLVGYLDRLGLGEIADRPVRSYSTGERQRLGLAMSLIGDPRILVLDEPMSGLDPAGIVELRKMLRELGSEGRAILLSSHLLHEVERVCDVVTAVDGGRVISAGHPSSLAQGPMDLLVSFASPAEREMAVAVLGAHGFSVDTRGPAILVRAAAGRARAVSELLGSAALYATELRPADRGLEEAYLGLIDSSRVARTDD